MGKFSGGDSVRQKSVDRSAGGVGSRNRFPDEACWEPLWRSLRVEKSLGRRVEGTQRKAISPEYGPLRILSRAGIVVAAKCLAVNHLREFLEPFRLRIHPHKSIVFPTRCGLPFLGYRLLPDRIRLGRKHLLNLRQRLREFERRFAEGMVSVEEAKASLQSWWGYAMHADCRTVVHAILSDFPFLDVKDEDVPKPEKFRRRFAT